MTIIFTESKKQENPYKLFSLFRTNMADVLDNGKNKDYLSFKIESRTQLRIAYELLMKKKDFAMYSLLMSKDFYCSNEKMILEVERRIDYKIDRKAPISGENTIEEKISHENTNNNLMFPFLG